MKRLSFASLIATFAVLVAFHHVAATSTVPLVQRAADLPYHYAVRSAATGSLNITTEHPADGKFEARGQYNRSNAITGWDYVMIEGDPYAAGYLEGYVTKDVIWLSGLTPMPSGDEGTWITSHIAYLKSQVAAQRNTSRQWAKIGEIFELMRGIADGATAAAPSKPLTFQDVFLINFQSELGDVQAAVANRRNEPFTPNFAATHCSALIKVTADDLFVAHDMWDSFTGMAYRQHKVYKLRGSPTVVFSGHPAYINSQDDWYMTSHELAIQETTNMVWNMSLYVAVVPETISEFLRVMSATLLATNGEEWTLYFSRENSGTYNNQYMVVDFKKYAPGSTIAPGTLWVAEQIPGMVHRADVSDVLQRQGYWASYNWAYFKDIYDISGYEQQKEEYGSFYSYTKYARPEIFARNQGGITDVASMMHMMRFNQFETDPLSKIPNCSGTTNGACSPAHSAMLSIASRGDLMSTYNTTAEMVQHYGPLYSFMACGCFGAIDSKIASYKNRHSLTSWVISGPTNDNQPAFEWNTGACAGTPAPAMTPTTVDFAWVEFQLAP